MKRRRCSETCCDGDGGTQTGGAAGGRAEDAESLVGGEQDGQD